ncbi:MAG: ABC transporter ATP-binding protein [Desulfobacterales bacterium]|nr:ABC transporter ATP-binding protein [Desulfobacterales bacterium]
MMSSVVEWNHVDYDVRSGFFNQKQNILKDVNVEVYPGSVVGLIGPNGAGKTTTLKLGCGLLTPSSGTVNIRGQKAVSPSARVGVGYVPEQQNFSPNLKVMEWLCFLAHVSGVGRWKAMDSAKKVLVQMELEQKKDALLHTLSKGQIQRVGIAQALLGNPDVLFLDEPMSGLDPFWRQRMMELLLDFQSQGGTIVFSSHILVDIHHISSHIFYIQNGKIQWKGKAGEFTKFQKQYRIVFKKWPNLPPGGSPEFDLKELPNGTWTTIVEQGKKDFLLKQNVRFGFEIESITPMAFSAETFKNDIQN